MPEKILVTSALPYANGPIHLGHLAGAYLPADIFVRYHRLKKNDIVYICGSDEHGVPIMLRARKEGVAPQEIVDRYHKIIKESFKKFGIGFDYYGRTSSKVHHETSQDFFNTLAGKDEFVLKKEEQLYDPEAGIFLADRFVRGTCPKCKYEEAYGDQCENCGTSLSPQDLINPRSAITNAKPVMKETTHWFLPLEKYQPELEKWIDQHSDWKPNALGQIKSWFKDGLRDRAVTRDLPWGVPVPKKVAEQAGTDANGKVLYVWFDAPIGYISASREWAEQKGDPDLWKKYWQEQDTRLIHFIGKDNIVFHCLIFPAMLKAHGQYVLPENVPANEFLNLEGDKLSTSRDYAVWLDKYLENFEPDSLRYCLASIMPETKDSDFSWKDFQARHNNELADILGNFINRSAIFCHKYFDGKLPQLGELSDLDKELIKKLEAAPQNLGGIINSHQYKNYVREAMDLARFANKYFNDKEPWKTRKENPDDCATTIHLCLQTVRALGILFDPLLPFTSEKIRVLLNIAQQEEWDKAANQTLETGHKINQPEILFAKIEDEPIEEEIKKLKDNQEPEKAADTNLPEFKETIEFDDFGKLDLRVAKVIHCEKVPKTNRLLKLTVELGQEERTIVSGIAEQYSAEELVGKNVVVIANLKPVKIRGVESRGMLLTSENDSKLSLLTVMQEIPSGSCIS
ncbi:MAG: methionine--tRNA ligase [Calditrichaeota bacterium]|nr:MAG: methionine--tRNA ligase [Calditrichota bacterium]MBL1206036.1 methionine--tRNA ligase [Calditrichota bacterium]NOG45864.1 methionine--tRNA ligase [Calditrichota bacterium]